jgi:HPt (histidine-containing phosphotransfer) domain-containing protein
MAESTRNNQSADAPATLPLPIDTAALLTRCQGSLSFVEALLEEFESTGAQRVAEIKRLAASADCDATADAAHSLKGAVAIMGAEPLRRLAEQIEELGRAGGDTQLEALTEQLAAEMQRCLDFIPTIHGDPADR